MHQKFFTYDIGGVTSGFSQMGVPLAQVAAPMVAIVELVGVMLGAIYFAKLSGGFFAPAGIEFELTLGAAALCVAISGGGSMTADAMIGKGKAGD